MRRIYTLFFILHSSFLIAQPLKGIWHGKIYDTNGVVVKYINVSIQGEGDNLIGIIRKYDDAKWMAVDEGKSKFISSKNNAILSNIAEQSKSSESNVYMFSFISSKRIKVEWISQLNNLPSKNNVIAKRGTGFLEPFLDGKIYETLSIGGSSTNRVSIDKVEIAKEVTVITFSYHNTSVEQVMMRLSKPGAPGAYYITPTDRSKRYYIINKDNIAFEPDNTLVDPNSYHTFKIYFEAIPETLTSFSILEGDPGMQSGKEWNFYDIQLK